ncbi:MAG: cobalamin biosynthesis protein CobD [Deltaproteobacteria bacterium]|nr:cobalamin biosynthesis protein CobD [Deltaproteobacteria bacterium]
MFTLEWYVIPLALILDLIVGDPHNFPHPVRWMGNAISFFEPYFRKIKLSLRVTGGLFAVSLILLTLYLSYTLLSFVASISHFLGVILEVVMVYYSLSIRCLNDEALEVYKPLITGSIEEAKQKLSFIVGRDVSKLNEEGIARAAVETVAENFVDGVVSPLFYATLLGGPFALCFKMINTLDSMIGYKNEKYLDFGRYAAKIDDVANYLPARISVHVIALSSKFLNGREHHVYRTCGEEGRNHKSPNAGYPEAAFAAVLSVKLGGPNYYFGEIVEKPYIGERFGETKAIHIKRACEFMMFSSIILGFICFGISFFLF